MRRQEKRDTPSCDRGIYCTISRERPSESSSQSHIGIHKDMTIPSTETIRGLRPAGLRCGHRTSHGGTESMVFTPLGVAGEAVLGMVPRQLSRG